MGVVGAVAARRSPLPVRGRTERANDGAERATIRPESTSLVFVAGLAVGLLNGIIGLGGAEFRLPLMIGFFGFTALAAVTLNRGHEAPLLRPPAISVRMAIMSAAEIG